MSKQHRFMRTLSIALVAVLALSSAPFSAMSGISIPSFGSLLANAANEEPVWTVATEDMLKIEGNTITGFTDKLSGNIEIPTHINGTAITAIAASAFRGCEDLTAVKISYLINSIGVYAFQDCSNLKKVYFNSNNCSMNYSSGLNTNAAPFAYNSNLTEFVFGENVTNIPSSVCYGITSLQSVTFEGDVTEIGSYSFANCSSLKGIDFSNVRIIGSSAFIDCVSISEITFSDNLEKIGGYAFYGCSIEEITIPAKVNSIGVYAFQECSNLKKVYFNSNNCSMNYSSGLNTDAAPFAYNSNLTEFVFGENVTNIPSSVCYGITSLQSVTFEGDVTEIGSYSFANCSSLKGIDFSNVRIIGSSAFIDCVSISEITFSDNLEKIGGYAFYGCSIEEITIPAKVNSIGVYAFQECSNLKKVYFNSNNCSMNYSSGLNTNAAPFAYNSNLTEFVFGENVTAIPANVCCDVSSLKTVSFEGKVTAINKNAFANCTSLSDVYYNAGSQADWEKVTIAAGNDILTSDDVTVHYGVYPVNKDNTEFGVEVTYTNKCFDEEVELKVEETDGERAPGAVYLSDSEIKTQVGCFEIKMVSGDGTIAQPNAGYKVTVKMAIPAEYAGKKNFRIVHRLANGGRENFSTSPKGNELKLTVKGNYLVFEVSSFSEFEVSTFEKIDATVKIKNNSKNRTINYGETLKLTALAEKTDNLPEDVKICWYVDGVLKGEGETFEFRKESGNAEITVKLVDGEDNVLVNAKGEEISDSQNVTVKAGFFQKLISFFKNLFGISRIVEQAFGFKLIVE